MVKTLPFCLMSVMDPNPYAPPRSSCRQFSDVVNRDDRDGLAALIRRFLCEELSAFDFDEALFGFTNVAAKRIEVAQ